METFNTLCFLWKKLDTNIEYFDIGGASLFGLYYVLTIKLKKKENITPQICNILQITQIPGVSINMSRTIINKYGSIKNLIGEYDKIDTDSINTMDSMLKNLEYNTTDTKTRKIGPVISRRIREFIYYNS